ncbi:hypothetical protein BKA62DRAFT_687485 [Auriculariales sp. MPI-PUGE-AT-0066]|nr:hypothetical protein BKA62DRAFT_687485 [Auriculariales sp. MPI-PUGE-AT-0066]
MSSSTLMSPSRKGKERAQPSLDQDEFLEIRPTLTYRHLLAKNPGVRSPFRVVALCDSDAFYASCERVRLNLDPEVPLVVQQWDSLIAVNYPARKFGISRMDKILDAKKRCPDLNVVHVATFREGDLEPGYWPNPDTLTHKVSLDYYRRESAKVVAIFKETVPEAEVEKASIDECFVDFSGPVRTLLLERFPVLAQAPQHLPLGLDTPLPPVPPDAVDWTPLGTLIPVHPPLDNDASTSPESAYVQEPKPTWHDVALSVAAELMAKVRQEGLSRNKFLAKLCASYKKPNSQSVLRNEAIPLFLRPMAFQKIRFLGGKLGKALAAEYDVSTVGDLLSISLDEMQRKFGEESLWVWEVLRGIDRNEVKEKPIVTKSMLASKNLPKMITKPSQGNHWIRVLASELYVRLVEAREQTPTLWPKTLSVKTSLGWKMARSKQAQFPFTRTLSVESVYSLALKLWQEMVGIDATAPPDMKFTHIGLAFGGVAALGSNQSGIEGFLNTGGSDNASDEMLRCSRCNATIKSMAHEADDVEVAREKALLEHEDWHFARDLARQPNSSPDPETRPAVMQQSKKRKSSLDDAGQVRKKKKVVSVGIAKYFAKK